MALLFVGSGLQLLFPIGAGRLVDGTLGYGEPGWRDINAVCLGLVGVVACIVLLKYWESRWFQEAGERAVAELRLRVFGRLVRLPLSWFGPRRGAEVSSRLLADLGQVQELWIFDLRQVVANGALLLGCLAMLLFTSWKLCLSAALALPPCILLGALLGRKIRGSGQQALEAVAAGANVVQDALQAMPMVKSFQAEARETAQYAVSLQGYLDAALSGSRQRAAMVSGVMLFLLSAYVFVMWKGSVLVREKELTPGGFTAFMFYLGFSATAAGFMAENFTKVQRALGAHARVREVLEAAVENAEHATAEESLAAARAFQGDLRVEELHFSYPSRPDTPVLRGVSCEFPVGKLTALVGGSGAGKSTLISLLGRLYEPSQGRVWVGAVAAADFSLAAYRSRLAFVPQEVLLFGGSIGENIAFGKPEASAAEIEQAARLAHAHDFIQALPAGYATQVGDRGAQLSGGQRQRVALARALLLEPSVLILDEATSALDAESEQHIQAALTEARAGRTTIVIAHRLSTIRDADHVVVLRDGKVAESGTPAALRAAGGDFAYLFAELQG
jgi:ATP-binding cassette, subfamily B, bacterial